MAFNNVWIGPAIIAGYSILAVFICIVLSAHYHNIPRRWPFLSEIATKPPASNVYALMSNHVALMVAIWVYMKHRELVAYFSMEHQFPKKRLISSINMWIGFIGALAMQMSVNFPKDSIPFVQTYASLVLLWCTVIYIWIHTLFSFFVIDPNIARVKLVIVRSSIAAALTSCGANMLKIMEIRGHNFDKTTPAPSDINGRGAIFEWGVYFAMCMFLLTDAYEFRNLSFSAPKLVIPGSATFDEQRLSARTRQLSFADFSNTLMNEPLVR